MSLSIYAKVLHGDELSIYGKVLHRDALSTHEEVISVLKLSINQHDSIHKSIISMLSTITLKMKSPSVAYAYL